MIDHTIVPVRLARDGQSDLTFEGKLIAEVTSDPNACHNRWAELKLYNTKNGKFIAQSLGCSRVAGESIYSTCKIFTDVGEAGAFFTVRGKVTWLSLKMYDAIRHVYPQFDHVEKVS